MFLPITLVFEPTSAGISPVGRNDMAGRAIATECPARANLLIPKLYSHRTRNGVSPQVRSQTGVWERVENALTPQPPLPNWERGSLDFARQDKSGGEGYFHSRCCPGRDYRTIGYRLGRLSLEMGLLSAAIGVAAPDVEVTGPLKLLFSSNSCTAP